MLGPLRRLSAFLDNPNKQTGNSKRLLLTCSQDAYVDDREYRDCMNVSVTQLTCRAADDEGSKVYKGDLEDASSPTARKFRVDELCKPGESVASTSGTDDHGAQIVLCDLFWHQKAIYQPSDVTGSYRTWDHLYDQIAEDRGDYKRRDMPALPPVPDASHSEPLGDFTGSGSTSVLIRHFLHVTEKGFLRENSY